MIGNKYSIARCRTLLQISTVLISVWLIVSAHAIPAAAAETSPIQRALGFLLARQLARPLDVTVNGSRIVDFPGDWPQFYSLRGSDSFRVRDVSPFNVAFIHHALTYAVEGNQHALGLSAFDVAAARLMRRRAIAFMKGFESRAGDPDAGTFAFWPYDTDPDNPNLLLTVIMTRWLRGPILGGQRVPINLAIYPTTLAIPSDADVTATIYSALLDDAALDGGEGTTVAFDQFFVDWRDLGVVPRRKNPSWLEPASGAFLTWLTYRDASSRLFPNDVDLVVNGNVLNALGRIHRLDAPGASNAADLINLAAALGLHRGSIEEISDYYPNNLAFQYVVSRAFREGGVAALEPAVQTVAADLETSVLFRPDGSAYWDLGDPHLNTAFAVLTLLNAGRNSPIVDRAVQYLAAEQNVSGGFDEATFFLGRTDGGQVFEFSSPSFTTAMALEAMTRYTLARRTN